MYLLMVANGVTNVFRPAAVNLSISDLCCALVRFLAFLEYSEIVLHQSFHMSLDDAIHMALNM